MTQLTLRLDDELAKQVRAQAGAVGRSVNGWIVAVLSAAVDPDLADTEAERTRARLERAGLLVRPPARHASSAPDRKRVEQARAAASGGTPVSELVADGRG